jgi:hypothetical protein
VTRGRGKRLPTDLHEFSRRWLDEDDRGILLSPSAIELSSYPAIR